MADRDAATGSTPPTDRVRVRRAHERGRYDRATIEAILDAGMICHVGYVADGQPFVAPTIHWRAGDRVFWHGSSASRALRTSEGADVCLTVTHLDGLVLARSAFHHSANYRSVMVLGKAEKLEGRDVRLEAMKGFVERLFPGRWGELRPVTEQEIKATAIFSLPLDEASAKVRNGPPIDDEEDYGWPVWAGVVPLQTGTGTPVDCPRQSTDAPASAPLPAFLAGR